MSYTGKYLKKYLNWKYTTHTPNNIL
jgi:hypothetical protein